MWKLGLANRALALPTNLDTNVGSKIGGRSSRSVSLQLSHVCWFEVICEYVLVSGWSDITGYETPLAATEDSECADQNLQGQSEAGSHAIAVS